MGAIATRKGQCKRRRRKRALEKPRTFFHFRTGPAATAAAGCSNRRIMVVVGPNRWLMERSRPFHPQVIQTQMLSRVFVFSFSGEHYDAPASRGIVCSCQSLRFYRGAPSHACEGKSEKRSLGYPPDDP